MDEVSEATQHPHPLYECVMLDVSDNIFVIAKCNVYF